MQDIYSSAIEFLKIVPGISIFPLSFYLAWKKIGTSISCSIDFQFNNISANQIKNIVLSNNKDKTITIFSIQAVIDKDISFNVEEFESPIILKSLESISISAKPYSFLYIGNEKFELNHTVLEKIDIYLSTSAGIIKCKNISHPSIDTMAKLCHFTRASKSKRSFNGIVYNNEKASFAITYKYGKDVKTAIVDKNGLISEGWDYKYNHIEPEFMKSTAGVKQFLELSKADKIFEIYGVDRLE